MQETPVRFLGREDPLEKVWLPTPVFLGPPPTTETVKINSPNPRVNTEYPAKEVSFEIVPPIPAIHYHTVDQ